MLLRSKLVVTAAAVLHETEVGLAYQRQVVAAAGQRRRNAQGQLGGKLKLGEPDLRENGLAGKLPGDSFLKAIAS